ncbi:MAG: valine--tRNA ligase [Bacteroidota bacterium]
MNLPTRYDPSPVARKWYQHWLQQGFFKVQPHAHKKPYAIVMPPPNVTGTLHMGHVLNHTLQDALIRRARMQGKAACWVPGLDHASIATEAKVVAMLRAKGINKQDLTREEFLRHAWAWKNTYGGLILEQLRELGASCDWERTRFTMEPSLTEAVQDVFIQLYDQGYIYQGKRMINWDPVGRTALSDDEVIYKTVDTKLYYIRYSIVERDQEAVVATTRPETLLGDTAICVHPEDTRYQHLHGKTALVPIVNRPIPIIADNYVDPTLGTGCLKVTPAHDINDYALGQKHHLPVIDILREDGTLSQAAQYYVGEDRFVAREKIVQYLQAQGQLVKTEPHTSSVGFSERTDAMVEPRISTQWFVRMQALAKPALEHVLAGTIQFHPPKFKNMYRAWLENLRDWCISRQLWWGQRIPAFYLPDGTAIVAKDPSTALAKAKTQAVYQDLTVADLRQDEDVLDTWFSSWLWPISVLDGWEDPDSAAIQYFYPTEVLVTAPEIIFFWVARMVMAGYTFRGQPPFRHVYFTGIVRDKLGRKMAKSLGNSPDPIALIKKYGADGVRIGMLLSTNAGNDLLFDLRHCEQGRNFANKLWNACRLIKGWQVYAQPQQENHTTAIQWFEARLNQALEAVEAHFENFRISDALMATYKLIWDDFCAWYLEMVKPAPSQPITPSTHEATTNFLARLLKLLHPFMPFITEELWHRLQVRSAQDCLIVAPWPQAQGYDPSILDQAAAAFALIVQVRKLRIQARLKPKQPLSLYSNQSLPPWLIQFAPYVQKLAHITQIAVNNAIPPEEMSFTTQGQSFLVPLEHPLDQAQKQERLHQELTYYQGFLATILEKLNNQQFIKHAPQPVVALERKKQADVTAKIALLQQRLAQPE